MPVITTNGIRLYYEVHGQGEPLVLIMGLGGDNRHFNYQARHLSRYYQVILFDNRGAGRSDAPAGDYTTVLMMEDLAGLLRELAILKAHILGFSLGSYIAQEFALRYPDRVRSLMLAASSTKAPPRAVYMQKLLAELVRRSLSLEDIIKLSIPWFFHERLFADTNRLKFMLDMANLNAGKMSAQGYLGQVAASVKHDTTQRIHQLKMPVLLLAGANDAVVSPEDTQALKKLIPHAEMVVFKEAGHSIYFEAADEFNKAVLAFLNKHCL